MNANLNTEVHVCLLKKVTLLGSRNENEGWHDRLTSGLNYFFPLK